MRLQKWKQTTLSASEVPSGLVCATVTKGALATACCLATVEDKSNHKNSNWAKKLCYK